MIKISIPGEPFSKQRPRVTRAGVAFTPKETVNYELWVKTCFMEQGGIKLEGQIKATINAYFSIPKTTSKKNRELMLQGKILHTKRKDADNLAKAILDSLNKIAYDDDGQVCELIVRKLYSDIPRVEVALEEFR